MISAAPATPAPPASAKRRGRPRVERADVRPYVEAVKVSKGTWAFRLRWKYSATDRPLVYVDRVSDEVYDLIKKEFYSEYKESLRNNYKGTVPARQSAA